VVKRALLFGRFQPVHKGHISIAKWAYEELGVDEMVFLIGMASESYTPKNPFTAGERIEMIRLSYKDEGLPLDSLITSTVHTLETNIGSVVYVLSYVPKVDYILARNPIIVRIFSDFGLKVVEPPSFNREKWRGEVIRDLIARGDPSWREAVTPSVAKYIVDVGGVERIRALYSRD
jgi:nicotinamide-nucleotide adenylyltransferase